MQERKRNMAKRKNPFIRIAVLPMVIVALLLLSQTVFAQNTYVITDGGRILVHTSSTTDPAAVLTEAGLALGADDTYTTQSGMGISEITVQRSHQVTVDNCGEVILVNSTDETVGTLLANLGITLDGNVSVSAPMEMETFDGLTITLSRTVQQVQTYTTSIAHDVTYYNDYSLPAGTTEVVTPGQDGQLLCTANVVYVDGKETDRTVIEQRVVEQPVNEVVAVGVASEKPAVQVLPADLLTIEDGHIILPDGQVLSYTHTMQASATAYNHNDAGCDMITATGTTVHIGTVAVDPTVIPFGTRMFIVTNDGQYVYGISTAEDCGSSIKKDKVDLYFPTYEECMDFGIRGVTIYFLG